MKKLLVILVLSLLWCNVGFAGTSGLLSLWPYFKDGKLIRIPSYSSGPFPNEFMSLKDGSYKNSPVNIDASCITYGYTIGGDKGRKISGKFKKFFIKNLLN